MNMEDNNTILINQSTQPNSDQDSYESEKQTLLKMQFSMILKKLENTPDANISIDTFEMIWNTCEEYMMQVLRYAISQTNNTSSTDSTNVN